MNKREFIKAGLIGVVGMAAIPSVARDSFRAGNNLVNIPHLPYSFDSFNNFLSEKNLRLHYSLFLKSSELLKKSLAFNINKVGKVSDVLLNSQNFDNEKLTYTGTYLNHKIFFKSIKPDGNNPNNELLQLINKNFNSFALFKAEFEKIALSKNNPGWIWLNYKNNKLFISTTNNDENPLMSSLTDDKRGYPLLGLDMWEHAYYTDYENNSKKYVKNFWNYVDWNFVGKRFERAVKTKI